MHHTLTDAGFTPEQAAAVVKVLQGGAVTKHDLDLAVARLESRIDSAVATSDDPIDSAFARLEGRFDRLDSKLDLILVVAVLAVLAPAVSRLLVG